MDGWRHEEQLSVLPYGRHSSVVEDSPKGHKSLQVKSPSPQKQKEKETNKKNTEGLSSAS